MVCTAKDNTIPKHQAERKTANEKCKIHIPPRQKLVKTERTEIIFDAEDVVRCQKRNWSQ